MNKLLMWFSVYLIGTSSMAIFIVRLITGELDPGFAYAMTIICSIMNARWLVKEAMVLKNEEEHHS